MNTYNKIIEVAIKDFGNHGYKGASLSDIAKKVGIKKPSLYAHFRSKQDLFETCLEDSVGDTLDEMRSFIESSNDMTAEKILYKLLNQYGGVASGNNGKAKNKKEGLEESKNLFGLRFMYMPPEELGENKVRYSNEFIVEFSKMLEEPISRLLHEKKAKYVTVNEAKESFICIYDGLSVELLFGGSETYRMRLEAVWSFFMKGIK